MNRMNRLEAKNKLSAYLKKHNISFSEDFDNGVPRITMLYKGYNNCPDKVLESCIWLYANEMEVRVYFDENASSWCKNSNYIDGMMRLLNFINARVWPQTVDGMEENLYQSHYLHTPRLYVTEEAAITMTSMIAYDFYSLVPVETEDYITACCPELLDKLSPAIFGVLLGQLSIEQAIAYVKEHVLYEKEETVSKSV